MRIKSDATRAAVLNRTILVPTAVPHTLAASLAPKDQPKKRPLDRKRRTPNIRAPLQGALDGVDFQTLGHVLCFIGEE